MLGIGEVVPAELPGGGGAAVAIVNPDGERYGLPPHSSTEGRGSSPLNTVCERLSLAGRRIKHLGAVVRDLKWCPAAITNSLCVKRVRATCRVNTKRTIRERCGTESRPNVASGRRLQA